MHMRKGLNSRRICFENQHGSRFMVLFWNPNMAAMTSCENTPFIVIIYHLFTFLWPTLNSIRQTDVDTLMIRTQSRGGEGVGFEIIQ